MSRPLSRLFTRGPADPQAPEDTPRRNFPLPRPVDVAERIERAPALDGAVRSLSQSVVRALPAGPRADTLHGVPFGQPAHPALVRLPLGCWTSAALLDLFPGTERAAQTLIAAGIATSLPATATGLADWSALHQHQQRVGLVHAASGACAATLFSASLLARVTGFTRVGKALSAGGLTAVTVGGYLGGHLALRLGAGASHAEPIGHLAGLGWHDVCRIYDLPDGRPVRRQLGYLSLFVLRRGADVSVLSDHCAHLGGPLHQGRVVNAEGEGDPDGDCVTCPWHGSTFRVSDGSVVHGPATARQPSFRCRVGEGGMVQVQPRTLDRRARGRRSASRPRSPR
ncbi:MAG TPA: Rieske 2Fe-2S domain-containing protein [Streptosporangiaceae bacterium]|nr:Rieske 2Fe-2S domain-containing protein [Streptosporangiaceae bacterium]